MQFPTRASNAWPSTRTRFRPAPFALRATSDLLCGGVGHGYDRRATAARPVRVAAAQCGGSRRHRPRRRADRAPAPARGAHDAARSDGLGPPSHSRARPRHRADRSTYRRRQIEPRRNRASRRSYRGRDGRRGARDRCIHRHQPHPRQRIGHRSGAHHCIAWRYEQRAARSRQRRAAKGP